MLTRLLIVPLLIGLTASPVFAKPIVIAELGSAPLLGTSRSTAEMRARVADNQPYIRQAVRKLGLNTRDYATLSSAIAQSQVAWVTVPRHLDAMTWRSGSTVYVLHNVMIPAATHGWEIDLQSGDQKIAVYMPAACGNLSVVRTTVPAVALHRPKPKAIAPVVAVAAPVEAPAAAEAPAVVPDDTPLAAPATVAQTEFPPAPAAAARHSLLPLLVPLLFGVAALSGGSGNGPIAVLPDGCP